MCKTRVLLAAVLLSPLLSIACLAKEGDDTQVLVAILMERGNAKDVAGLDKLREQAMASDESRYAYHLARYIADRGTNEDSFIAAFPVDSGAVMGYVYNLELATDAHGRRFTPTFLFAFDELGKFAVAGKPPAIKKLFDVATQSGGVVSEFVCEKVSKTITDQAAGAVVELSKESQERRQRIYACFGTASANELASMKASLQKVSSPEHAALITEVVHALETAY